MALAACAQASIPLAEGPSHEPTGSEIPFVSGCKRIALVLTKATVGRHGVEVQAELLNTGNAPIELMTTDDGSTENMRNPTLMFEACR